MNRYPIGCWTYIRLSEIGPNFVKDYHDLGLTNPMTPIFDTHDDPAQMIALLDHFHALGMKVVVYDNRVTAHTTLDLDEDAYRTRFQVSLDQFGAHPAVSGFYVTDEPDYKDTPHALMAARVQYEMAPHLTPLLNFDPWVHEWQPMLRNKLNVVEYKDYLDRAIETAHLPQVGNDCYTQMWEGEKGYDSYFTNLRELRDAGNRYNIPFCMTLLATGTYDYECPDQDAFRWQISTAAALGAKALMFFGIVPLYRLPEGSYRRFPINFFRERTEAFQWLSEENRIFLSKFADLLLKLRCVKSEFSLKAYGGLSLFQPDDTLFAVSNSNDLNMLISTFVDEDGVKYRAVVNLDRKKAGQAFLHFAPTVKTEYISWDNKWYPRNNILPYLAPGQLEIIRETPAE